MTNSFLDPIYTFFMILFGLFDLILLFLCQICHVIVKQKIENKQNLFLKKFSTVTPQVAHTRMLKWPCLPKVRYLCLIIFMVYFSA